MRDVLLFVSRSERVYGAQVALLDLIDHLTSNKFACILAAPKKDIWTKAVESSPDLRLAVCPSLSDPSWVGRLRSMRFVNELIRQHNVSLIHLNHPYGLIGRGVMAAWRAGIPVVTSVRTRYWAGPVERYFLSRADKIICISDYLRRELLQPRRIDWIAPLDPDRVLVIPTVRDFSYLDSPDSESNLRNELRLPATANIVSTIGRIDPNKNQQLFLEMAAHLHTKDSDIHFCIAGDLYGNRFDSYLEEIKKTIQAHHLEKNVHLLGFRDDISNILAASDVMVFTSKREGLCNALMEAMYARRPVVTTDAGATPEVVGEEDAAILVNPPDPAALADAVMTLLRIPERAREMGQRARQRICRHFNMATEMKRLENVYRELIANCSSKQ